MTTLADFISLADFEALLADPTHADHLLELIDGEVVEKVPTEEHGAIAVNIVLAVGLYVRQHKLGRVTVEVRHQLPAEQQDPARARSLLPDVAFTSTERMLPLTREGGVPLLPDLVVEIQSPGQTDRLMSAKATMYVEGGTRMVWLVYPDRQLVEVLTLTDRHLLTVTGTIDGADVLPGFTLAVREVFGAA